MGDTRKALSGATAAASSRREPNGRQYIVFLAAFVAGAILVVIWAFTALRGGLCERPIPTLREPIQYVLWYGAHWFALVTFLVAATRMVRTGFRERRAGKPGWLNTLSGGLIAAALIAVLLVLVIGLQLAGHRADRLTARFHAVVVRLQRAAPAIALASRDDAYDSKSVAYRVRSPFVVFSATTSGGELRDIRVCQLFLPPRYPLPDNGSDVRDVLCLCHVDKDLRCVVLDATREPYQIVARVTFYRGIEHTGWAGPGNAPIMRGRSPMADFASWLEQSAALGGPSR